jgi:polyisoprenoid-binding protein YceI
MLIFRWGEVSAILSLSEDMIHAGRSRIGHYYLWDNRCAYSSFFSRHVRFFCVVLGKPALSETWDLPTELNDRNTNVTFVVDSTWHTVRGITKNISGSVRLDDAKDSLAVAVDLRVPVRFFDTNSELRDDRLREVMAADAFPEVRFVSTRLSEECNPSLIDKKGSCQGSLSGILSIRDVTKTVSLPVSIQSTPHGYRVEGAFTTRWEDFHVEDPSIIVARLDPFVTISYQTMIPKKE